MRYLYIYTFYHELSSIYMTCVKPLYDDQLIGKLHDLEFTNSVLVKFLKMIVTFFFFIFNSSKMMVDITSHSDHGYVIVNSLTR